MAKKPRTMPTGLGITYATSAVGPAEGRQAAGLTTAGLTYARKAC